MRHARLGGVPDGLATIERHCEWCGRRFETRPGPGRPRLYCRRSCRQRDYEARAQARQLGLNEGELVVTRQELSRLDDLVYVLACAVEDVERDLAEDHNTEDIRRALDWLMEAAAPLAALSRSGRVAASLGAPPRIRGGA